MIGIGIEEGRKEWMDYLGGGDVEALHTPNRGVEAGLLSLPCDHALLRWLLKSPKISRKFF